MPKGAEYPAAHATAVAIWERRIKEAEAKWKKPLSKDEREPTSEGDRPPYPVGSFLNRWWKHRPDFPSRTLIARIGQDTYSHIHITPLPPRCA